LFRQDLAHAAVFFRPALNMPMNASKNIRSSLLFPKHPEE